MIRKKATVNEDTTHQIAYTYTQAAHLLACSKDTVIRMCADGRLQRIYLNARSPRIPRWSLNQYLAEKNDTNYDDTGTTASAHSGESVWQKSTNAPKRPTGGQSSKIRMVKELDALLASPTKTR